MSAFLRFKRNPKFDRERAMQLFAQLWFDAVGARRQACASDLVLPDGSSVFSTLAKKTGYPIYWLAGQMQAWDEQEVTAHWIRLTPETWDLVRQLESSPP